MRKNLLRRERKKPPNEREKRTFCSFSSFSVPGVSTGESRFTNDRTNNSIRFYLPRMWHRICSGTGGINLLFVHVSKLVCVYFWLEITSHSSRAPNIRRNVRIYWAPSALQKESQVFYVSSSSPPSSPHWRRTCFKTSVVDRVGQNYVYRLKCVSFISLCRSCRMIRSETIHGVAASAALMFWMQCVPGSCVLQKLWSGCRKREKGKMVKIKCPCNVSHRSSGISIVSKIFSFRLKQTASATAFGSILSRKLCTSWKMLRSYSVRGTNSQHKNSR